MDGGAPERLTSSGEVRAVRVVTWNVNSVRSRLERLLAWLDAAQPDVVLLQETKCGDLPPGFAERGYEAAHHGAGGANGVAILSRAGLRDVDHGFDGEGRLVSATCGAIRVHSIYGPNGRKLGTPSWHHKVAWLNRLADHLSGSDLSVPTLVAGDWNVTPSDLDIYDPSKWRRRNHASVEERAALGRILAAGLGDVQRERQPGQRGLFSWWNYRPQMLATNRGLRIDFFLVTADLAARTERVWVDVVERHGEGTSDHAPVVLDLHP
jgi:exodeoxyribonuclease-3